MEIFGTIVSHYFGDYRMVLMEVNHVSQSNQNRFRMIGLTAVITLFGYLKPLMAVNRVMRDHQIGLRNQVSGHSLPMDWHVKTLSLERGLFGDWSRIYLTI